MSNLNIDKIINSLSNKFGQIKCPLIYNNIWQLLVATILSVQCKDETVNLVTVKLFDRYTNIEDYYQLNALDLEKLIYSTGFYKSKAKIIIDAALFIRDNFNGEVPINIDDLIKIKGVGRKIANVIVAEYANEPEGIAVDTHVIRISNRIGLVNTRDAGKIENKLLELIPKQNWNQFSHQSKALGRKYCIAQNPKCTNCPINQYCKYYLSRHKEKIGNQGN